MRRSATERDVGGRPRLRFPRRERLRGRRAVSSLLRASRRVREGGVAVVLRPNGMSHNRLLVSVRRGFRSAVERNRERRRAREIYRLLAPRLRSGYDVAIIVEQPSESFAGRRSELESALEKAGLLES